MTKRTKLDGEHRLMDENELMAYLNLGRNTAKTFGRRVGAERHIGRRVLYDKLVIDTALDNLD